MSTFSRRQLLQASGAAGLGFAIDAIAVADAARSSLNAQSSRVAWDATKVGTPFMRDPLWVYDNWSAYTDGIYKDEIFGGVEDTTRLNEALSLRQLQEIARLKQHGVHFDYYMMGAFWFDPQGAYRTWRQPDWPNGPDRWLDACCEQGIKPGLWFGTNGLWKINVAPQWRDSQTPTQEGSYFQYLSLFEGSFLADFMEALQHWYERGIRLFEFDVAKFDVATAAGRKAYSPEEIYSRNQKAFSDALKAFRRKNPDAMLVAFNDFGGDMLTTATPFPFKKPVDLRWLDVFDTLYTGDVRVSDVPMASFWRSVDLFNDHMTRRFEQTGIPLERCDPFFTLSSTWFGYHRQKVAWKSMLLLTAARGSWKKTIYGALDLLTDEDARWFAKVQELYTPLSAWGRAKTFGGIPGEVQPYGYGSFDSGGALYTVVNPTQSVRSIELPRLSRVQARLSDGRILFTDAGFVPRLNDATVEVGPEQMVLVGFGHYSHARFDLGIELDIVIPKKIEAIPASFEREAAANSIASTFTAPVRGDVRILFQQRAADGTAPRSKRMRIEAAQNGKAIPVQQREQHRAESTGISWGAGEIRAQELKAGEAIVVRCSSPEKEPLTLQGWTYVVEY